MKTSPVRARKPIFLTALIMALPLLCAAEPPQSFEAATIKPHDPGIPGFGLQITGHRLRAVNTSLLDLMEFAWRLHARQITGGPPWLSTERYDILAETGLGDAPIRTLLQNLVTDRFSLTLHRANQKLPVYTVTIAKGGPHLAEFPGDPNGNPTYGFPGLGTMIVNNAQVSDFAGWMQRYIMDRPVIDRTGILGRFTFNLKWRPDQFQFPAIAGELPRSTDDGERPDLFTLLRQQLGLTLVSTKADIEVLVIDRVTKPSEN